ncbi:MAG TPA: GDSL-type esterase/lipase family protein [Actinomycetota bacterium]
MDPSPFLRGNPYPGTKRVPYPRAKPGDGRLPGDTWFMATYPAGVRLELLGDAEALEVTYRASEVQPGWPADTGRAFEVWRGDERVAVETAQAGEHTATLKLGAGEGPVVVHLPERLAPTILDVAPSGGAIEPAARGPRWLCYGDSIAEGWIASGPGLAWPAIASRAHGLDVMNMGYAGACRGELVSAEQLAELEADVITLSHGTNCHNRVPFSTGLMRETYQAFLDILRQGHPDTPIVVVSPVLRPDAETTPNRLGASLADLRAVIEEVARARGLPLVAGEPIITSAMLADEVHPNDAGMRAIAAAVGPVVAEAVRG